VTVTNAVLGGVVDATKEEFASKPTLVPQRNSSRAVSIKAAICQYPSYPTANFAIALLLILLLPTASVDSIFWKYHVSH
jgi:hypothetical protein